MTMSHNNSNNHRYRRAMQQQMILFLLPTAALALTSNSHARHGHYNRLSSSKTLSLLKASSNDNDWERENKASQDANTWLSSQDASIETQPDWMDTLESKQDGTFWATFESGEEEDGNTDKTNNNGSKKTQEEDMEQANADAWLDTLASLSAEEVEFNQKESQRAEMAMKMEEWNFAPEVIAETLGVAVDDSLEQMDKAFQDYQEEAYLEEVDLETVESHKTVEFDTDGKTPIRSQMVYVDEVTCIGCTNCAMVAQSTFYMNSEHGRARVFQQWGDDDETIQVAIETCPVDCIHYVPYDELVELEKERRSQNINFKARLVSQGEYGGRSAGSRFGASAQGYTGPQKISGNMGARCNNCPSRGCRDCPMYGVGKNPEFERKEKERKARMERNRLKREREAQSKRAEL